MKVKFSRVIDYIPEYNDNRKLSAPDQIKTKLTVLTLAELAFVGEIIAKLGLDKEKGTLDAVKSSALKEMAADLAGILTAHVTLSGLEDETGPVEVAQLASLAPYMQLSLELLVELANISAPGETDVKNSNAPSA